MLGSWVQREGLECVTGPCGSDSSKRPPRSRHQSPSSGLTAIRGCKLDASSRNSNNCLVTTVVAMINIPVDDVNASEGWVCVGVEAKGGRGRARYMERWRSCMALKSTERTSSASVTWTASLRGCDALMGFPFTTTNCLTLVNVLPWTVSRIQITAFTSIDGQDDERYFYLFICSL